MLLATSWRPSGRLALGAVAAVAVGVTVAGMLPSSAAFAANSKTTAAAADQAQQKVDALGVQADKAVEAYDAAQAKLTTVTAQAKAQQAAVAKAEQQVDAAKAGIRTLAAAEYESGNSMSSISFLLSDDPASILQKAALLAQVNRAQSAGLIKVVNADREVEAAQARADQAVAAQKAASAQVAATKASVEKALAAQQAVLSSLQTKVKQQQASEAAAQRAAQVQQQAASRAQARTVLSPRKDSTGSVPISAPPAATGNAAAALAYAYAQLGKPYRFGGAGPGSFDCSGLAMRAWGAAGVSLSHSAAAQQHQGSRVSLSALQPGDLVFWGSPAYHVGIYVGGGRVLDAPHTGTVVQIQAIWGSPSGAVRP